jgi:cytochrome oxidase Cu insertion factor (SCO1/SenC/PrrC family)
VKLRALAWLGLLWVCLALPCHAAGNLWRLGHEFQDDQGRRLLLGQLRPVGAGAVVVAMEYSSCRFICTLNWRKLQEIQAEADRRHQAVSFVIVSLDPSHDSPAAWREYRQMRGLNRGNWHFLTGNRQATDHVVSQLGVKWWWFDNAIMHDLRILRLDAEGRALATLESLDQDVGKFLGG